MLAHPLLRRLPAELASRAIVVGGVVRDAVIGLRHGDDLDLVVEGALGPLPGWTAHDRFGTARRVFPEGVVHVGIARRERYPVPGALPEVSPGSLADDLARRDITVNAMAVPLGGPDAGRLIDPHGGRRDAEGSWIRLIRPDAFEEDPSRLVRVARYANRLSFSIAPETVAAARPVAAGLDLGVARVAGEFRRLLEEETADLACALLAALGVPWIRVDLWLAEAIDAEYEESRIPETPRWAARLAAMVDPAVLRGAALPGWALATAREVRGGVEVARSLERDAARSEVDRALARLPQPALLGALATGEGAVLRWWDHDRDRRLAIDGTDLVAAGVAPGPAIGRALAAVRAAVLDGEVAGRPAELGLALRVAEPRA